MGSYLHQIYGYMGGHRTRRAVSLALHQCLSPANTCSLELSGIYDTEYLFYIRSLLALLPEYGLTAFVSMHQDVWSRYSGGSGAPAWTLELVGFDLDALEATGAAYLGGVREPGVVLERGLWPTGYQKLACSTMNTVFWAGRTFAPKLLVERNGEKVHAQDFLQDALLDSYEWLVKGLAGLAGVIGFEVRMFLVLQV